MAEKPYGLIAAFDTTPGIYHACEQVRDAGYKRWDALTPFPVHGLDAAISDAESGYLKQGCLPDRLR